MALLLSNVVVSQAHAVRAPASCRHLLDDKLLPDTYVAALKAHPIARLARELNQGEDLFFYNQFLATKRAIAKFPASLQHNYHHVDASNWRGELKQTYFLNHVLRELFPRASGNHLAANEIGTNSNRVELEVIEGHGEMEDSISYYVDGTKIEMSRLKAANPNGEGLTREQAFAHFGLDPKLRILSMYVSHVERFEPGEWAALTSALNACGDYDLIIATAGTYHPHRSVRAATLRKFSGKFSDWLRDPGKFKHGAVIRNDTLGQMSLIHAISEAAVVAGPLNWFEPLAVKTPTVIYVPDEFREAYEPTRFRLIVDQAERSGGARQVHSLDKIVSTLAEWRGTPPVISPAGLIPGAHGRTPFDLLLDDLDRYLRANPVIFNRVGKFAGVIDDRPIRTARLRIMP